MDIRERLAQLDLRKTAIVAGLLGLVGVVALAFFLLEEKKPAGVAEKSTAAKVTTRKFDSWAVACPEKGGGKCMGNLRVMSRDGKSMLLNWVLLPGKDGGAISILQVPKGLGVKTATESLNGVDPARGLDLKFGDNPPRHLTFAGCQGLFCNATTPVDASFRAQVNGKTTVTVYTAQGKPMPLVLEQKGADQAINAILDIQ